jgi:hypothetical protein
MGDNDFPAALGFLKAYTRGATDYSQSGDLVPDLRLQEKYAQEEGMPFSEQTLISGSPSFDLRYPKMPGMGEMQQSIEGVHNATPEMIRKFIERKTKNPGGQELPGFLKQASAEGVFGQLAANQGPSTPVKYDESMGGFVPNWGAGRPTNVRYKGTPIGA